MPDHSDAAIPDSWPTDGPQELALFALPKVWLYPFVILPLHIYELRYQKMIEDNLDGAGRIAFGTFVPGPDLQGEDSPPIYPTACLGEIGRHDRLDDGRYNILLVGLRRIRVTEIESAHPYRMVRAENLHEIDAPLDQRDELRAQLIEAITQRSGGQAAIPADVTISHLADLLTLRLSPPHKLTADLFAELEVEQRARKILAQHASQPDPS